jgi:hypothetical protein
MSLKVTQTRTPLPDPKNSIDLNRIFFKNRNLKLRLELSRFKSSRTRTTSTVLHQVTTSPMQSLNLLPASKQSSSSYDKQTSTNSLESISTGSNETLFDKELQLQVDDDDSYESRYLTEFHHIRLIGKGGFGFVCVALCFLLLQSSLIGDVLILSFSSIAGLRG